MKSQNVCKATTSFHAEGGDTCDSSDDHSADPAGSMAVAKYGATLIMLNRSTHVFSFHDFTVFFYMVVPLHSKLFIFSWNSEIWMVKLSRDEF